MGSASARKLSEWPISALLILASLSFIIVLLYCYKRNFFARAKTLCVSYRLDVAIATIIGGLFSNFTGQWLGDLHNFAINADGTWALYILAASLSIFASSSWRFIRRGYAKPAPAYFLGDQGIRSADQDLYKIDEQAKNLAEIVLQNTGEANLIFGIDGPWGIGKTSFINLATNYWRNKANSNSIVFRFEPLRYGAEANLSEAFVKELSTAIQAETFAPELKPIASQYSRMLEGKTEFSFLGFKISLAPSTDTFDEIIEGLDTALTQANRKLIVVIDDLDRIGVDAVNNVLFTIKRTINLSRATYILCYDTENLVAGREGADKAREFFEKFVNIKLSLFIDSSMLLNFLEHDWKKNEKNLLHIPSSRMDTLSTQLGAIAEILKTQEATDYFPLIGDLRKIKRLVNTLILIQVDSLDTQESDFIPRDLIDLVLLNLNYPGIFRDIYTQETEGRKGIFSIKWDYSANKYVNSPRLEGYIGQQGPAAQYVLRRLFSSDSMNNINIEEYHKRSFACFNSARRRNLESYLLRIVRLVAPPEHETYALYNNAVQKIIEGKTDVASVFSAEKFSLMTSSKTHSDFWRVFVGAADYLDENVANQSISTLVDYIPRYSLAGPGMVSARENAIYVLVQLLDSAGWTDDSGRHRDNSDKNILAIAHRIFGEPPFEANGIIDTFCNRGVLGWNDLMLFRLLCSADRKTQRFNLQGALLLHADPNSRRDGLVSDLAINGMRQLTQVIFSRFKKCFIDARINFFDVADMISAQEIIGDTDISAARNGAKLQDEVSLTTAVETARSTLKSFVIYQLCNTNSPNGSGVGSGIYDYQESLDRGGIAVRMNVYLYEFCFNPDINLRNYEHFLNFCLSNFSRSFMSVNDDSAAYLPTQGEIAGASSRSRLIRYWSRHRSDIIAKDFTALDRAIFTQNYIATYREDLPKVYEVLDSMSGLTT
ncbi:P-loop NTPase fold protein [Ectopseudomonas mendocina]|uniref:P-loop NTPase fold protein n=1 Tax=Ectopseudomonas mendocina TaxID=300 RepID=UPI003F079EE8